MFKHSYEPQEIASWFLEAVKGSIEKDEHILGLVCNCLVEKKYNEAENALCYYLKQKQLSVIGHIGLSVSYNLLHSYTLAMRHSEIAAMLADTVQKQTDISYFDRLKEFHLNCQQEYQSELLKEKEISEIDQNRLDHEHALRQLVEANGRQEMLEAERRALGIHNKIYLDEWDGDYYRNKPHNEKKHQFPEKKHRDNPDDFEKYYMTNLVPQKPFITKDKEILAFGSCFAAEIADYLRENHYSVNTKNKIGGVNQVFLSDGMVNTYTLLQQFEWAFEGKEFAEQLWFGNERNIILEYADEVKEATKRVFLRSDIFIITLGLSEIWYNKVTDEVLMRCIPGRHFNSEVHDFRIANVDENLVNLEKIYQCIRKIKKNATVIFTLSPLAMKRTFRPIPCVVADSVSKAILRAAVDELTRRHFSDLNLYYFPSYEIVKNFFLDPYTDDGIHLTKETIDFIMGKFAQYFLK